MYTEWYCTSVKDWHMKKTHIIFDANNLFFIWAINCVESDHMHGPICNDQILLNEYSQHVNTCYEINHIFTLFNNCPKKASWWVSTILRTSLTDHLLYVVIFNVVSWRHMKIMYYALMILMLLLYIMFVLIILTKDLW